MPTNLQIHFLKCRCDGLPKWSTMPTEHSRETGSIMANGFVYGMAVGETLTVRKVLGQDADPLQGWH